MSLSDNSISVRQLNLYVKALIEGDERLSFISVTGEISNFKNHYASGHWYFTLKDADAAIRCVMFRSAAVRVKADISDGMLVTVKGRVSLYEKDGQYQFYAEAMEIAGSGELAVLFEQTKQRLLAEGLFDSQNKRPLPKFPKRIAVVTSETGAAVRDIINVTARRYPLCELVLCPVAVQGAQAVGEMLDALDRIYCLSDIDLIIIGRGGGSAEDLMAFNDERLARKLYEAPIPVISAVGHETDFSISDFVADVRAATPSAAAELAVPDATELKSRIAALRSMSKRALGDKYKYNKMALEALTNSSVLKAPLKLTDEYNQNIDRLYDRLLSAERGILEKKANDFSFLAIGLDALSPLKVMARGFSVAVKNGITVNSVNDLSEGEAFRLLLSDGSLKCMVEEIENDS